LIDATDAFQSTDIESVLRAEITRMLSLYLTVSRSPVWLFPAPAVALRSAPGSLAPP
jgi:hypothetical protein